MRFPRPGPTNKNDIACAGEIIPGIQLTEVSFVHLGFFEVEAIQIARHREARQAQLIFVGACLPIRHFSLQQLRQPRCRGKLHLARGRCELEPFLLLG